MPISKEELVNLLNFDLSKEYTAMTQYIQHSGVLTGAAYLDIKREIITHAKDELDHAVTIADQINYLGAMPTGGMHGQVKVSKDNVEMLQQDLELEEDAIHRYVTRIEQSEELHLLDLAQRLREILAVEQEHAMDLHHALGR